MGWRNCRASNVLVAEINARWPRRDKASDGTLGDAAHRRTNSSHNPNRYGVVRARDVDRDGIPVAAVVEHLRRLGASGFRPLRGGYLIYNRRIAGTHTGWAWRAYSGANPHTLHFHVDFADLPSNYDYTGSWNIRSIGSSPAPAGHSHATPLLRLGSTGGAVVDLQGHLNAWRKARGLKMMPKDGDYGPTTKYCVEVFQQAYGLSRDGICGNGTWSKVHSVTRGAIA